MSAAEAEARHAGLQAGYDGAGSGRRPGPAAPGSAVACARCGATTPTAASRPGTGGSTMLTLISCPDCGVPAEITERFSLPSTDGPVDHIVLHCARGHHFRMPADMLPPHSHPHLADRSSIAGGPTDPAGQAFVPSQDSMKEVFDVDTHFPDQMAAPTGHGDAGAGRRYRRQRARWAGP